MCVILAHSAGGGKPAQLYCDHVTGVVANARKNLDGICRFVSAERRDKLEEALIPAAHFHDLGKLDEANQTILRGESSRKPLTIEHRDAGVKYLRESCGNPAAATLVFAHHRPGLPNMTVERTKKQAFRYKEVAEHTDRCLDDYLKLHEQELGKTKKIPQSVKKPLSSLEYRMLLSCLVDADYSDSSGICRDIPPTRWKERAEKLDLYVAGLQKEQSIRNSHQAERAGLRQEMYHHCKTVQASASMTYCDAPVGTGKTTALMAYLLGLAERNALRHIIIVLPYINIISQAVKVYREALVLDGEDPQQIVAEQHHQTDYDDISLRHLAATWSVPIIVTTAVQFFESLASNIPSKLRKIHQLPGSAILLDESHAMFPAALMPLAWNWMEELSENWGCHFCLSSGTTVEYWKTDLMRDISTLTAEPLLPAELSKKLEAFESRRIKCNFSVSKPPHFDSADGLMRFIESKAGPRLVVMNTVMSAAVLAIHMRKAGMDVLHLSTALTPDDREQVLKEVQLRLESHDNGADWTLVATSCVECGLDLSFRNGFCELRCLQSAFQVSGRIGRNGEHEDACLYCFTVSDGNFSHNSNFGTAIRVFKELIAADVLDSMTISEAITLSFDMERKISGGCFDILRKIDKQCGFEEIAEKFRVIDEDTITILADSLLIQKIKSGQEITKFELMRGSVSIRKSIMKKLDIVNVLEGGELYGLADGQYDCFVGYMRSLIEYDKSCS